MNRYQKGFTLTELMVVTAIVAILLGIAIPSYKYLTTSYRLSAELNDLVGDLQLAREEALKEGVTVTVCPSANGTGCTGGTEWNVGWIVFSDPNANATVDPGERIVKARNAFSGTTPDTFDSGNGVTAVLYNREGFASTSAGLNQTKFLLQESTLNNAYTRCLILYPVGMAQAQTRVGNPATC